MHHELPNQNRSFLKAGARALAPLRLHGYPHILPPFYLFFLFYFLLFFLHFSLTSLFSFMEVLCRITAARELILGFCGWAVDTATVGGDKCPHVFLLGSLFGDGGSGGPRPYFQSAQGSTLEASILSSGPPHWHS